MVCRDTRFILILIVVWACGITGAAGQQAAGQQAGRPAAPPSANKGTVNTTLPPGYVIGSGDLLSVAFWRDKDMSADVVVRPDGKISLPLLNEVEAAGFTTEQLRARLNEAASKYLEEPNVSISVREIRSRNVYITGNVAKPAGYPLNTDLTVLQLIALAGGLQEYADAKNILIIRTENGREQRYKFNYKNVVNYKRVSDNILLKPGDTVYVP